RPRSTDPPGDGRPRSKPAPAENAGRNYSRSTSRTSEQTTLRPSLCSGAPVAGQPKLCAKLRETFFRSLEMQDCTARKVSSTESVQREPHTVWGLC
ncbi:unnamed protein product, partial [Ixodes persulcatus]